MEIRLHASLEGMNLIRMRAEGGESLLSKDPTPDILPALPT